MHVVLFPVCVVLNFPQTQDGLKYCGEHEVIFLKCHFCLQADDVVKRLNAELESEKAQLVVLNVSKFS